MRIILVGRCPMDQSLRRESDVELIRASDGLEAIGELDVARRLRKNGPVQTVVILGDDVVSEEPVDRLASSLRTMDEGICILGVANGSAWTPDAAFLLDGWLPRSAGVGEVHQLVLRRPSRDKGSTSEMRQMAPSTSIGPGNGLSSSPAADPTHDNDLLDLLLSGQDITGACLNVLRRQLGGSAVRLTETPEHGESVASYPVMRRAHCFGHLTVSTGVNGEAARSAAEWLGRWLALAAQQHQLRQAAYTDSLTGAWNRRYFDQDLRRALDQARDRRLSLSLLLFDIDNFKWYNDRFGHAAGDEILIETVRLLRTFVRPSDRVCRIGGDEFAVIFFDPHGPRNAPSEHPASIFDIASRFQRQICEHQFPKLGEQARGELTITGALATYPWDGHDAPSLLEVADRLLLESKARGKNVICFGPGAEQAPLPQQPDKNRDSSG